MFAVLTDAELDTFLALTITQRGERLAEMTPTERIRYAVAYARRDGRQPYRVLDTFETWMARSCDALGLQQIRIRGRR